jgi:hypothetical protein
VTKDEHRPPQFATRIPGRKPEFKPHTTLGLVKSAVGQRIRFDRAVNTHQKAPDGVFTCDMTVYTLKEGEYQPWIEVKRGKRRSDYPDLMPLNIPPARYPNDPPGHASRYLYEHLLKCPALACEVVQKWIDKSRDINEQAAKILGMSGWVVRKGEWFCKVHAEES